MYGINRVILIVLDSVGVGALPDAAEFGPQDAVSNTLAHTARAVGGLNLPYFQQMGLGNIALMNDQPVLGVPAVEHPAGAYGRMAQGSKGKDTTVGHWEIAGVCSVRPLPTFPDGFPAQVIDEFERRSGRKALGNYAASGTVIIQDLGDEHVRTGRPIVYTSADSVFQIAMHEGVIPIQEQYHICEIAREMLQGDYNVGRVIARPFSGPIDGRYVRTLNRRDFSAPPPHPTILDRLQTAGQRVMAVGKIEDIFAHRGITDAIHSTDNIAGIDATLKFMREGDGGLIFANLVDFDMLYGHRNDPHGYAGALEAVDARVPELLDALVSGDVLFFTADHGNDPTTSSTDHSREYVPLLACGERVRAGLNLGTRPTFADLGATVADLLGLGAIPVGSSFASELLKVSIFQ
ncbi:MAG: phosphopentomutase [Anaerolineae bacterium]|nr:phosphopentomutase [Anaerolineae bacterium]